MDIRTKLVNKKTRKSRVRWYAIPNHESHNLETIKRRIRKQAEMTSPFLI